jgi:hypothetical protein
MRIAVFLVLSSIIFGCSYKNEKAIRQYNEVLESIRTEIVELGRYQGYVNDKKSPNLIQRFVIAEILPRARRITHQLQALNSPHPKIKELNSQLAEIWTDYEIAFELFASDLTNINIRVQQRQIKRVLKRCNMRWRSWNVELLSLHESIVGWSG